ncbi:MAG: PEP-CTERM sorting domain-containing protein [Terracidiphilus sp.]
MRKTSIFTVIVFAALVVLTMPAYADSFVTFSQPAPPYTTSTIDFGGGDGSGNSITSLEPFTFSAPMQEFPVTNNPNVIWSTWNFPPAVESNTPNVLFDNFATTVTLTLSRNPNIVGFELEPFDFAVEDVTAEFFNQNDAPIDTIDLLVNGQNGALLFALEDTTPGASISSVVITDNTPNNGGFAIAQLRANPAPEPGTLSLLGLGMLGLAGFTYRKMVNG